MRHCSACGTEGPAEARFCLHCGAELRLLRGSGEERKVVTVLFADLVGFTRQAEHLDPEDVRALTAPYYSRLRAELERFGGTVEKFIGDAVMALFGAPVSHDDDPERAVRAALAIRDWVLAERKELPIRLAVNTGEVLITLDAQPSRGEGMASGDVVNTTARMQAAAPTNGILVGQMTYRATSHVIRYREAEPLVVKGKEDAVPAWEAVEPLSRLGADIARSTWSTLVGRSDELRVLTNALANVREQRSTHVLTLVGAPGIGKSRLVGELFRSLDADADNVVTWRQGRCLSYGGAVTFWALAEIVKAQLGVLESDTDEEAEHKLKASLNALLPDDPDLRWVERHLRPLLGLQRQSASGGEAQSEVFAAWRRFFQAIAHRRSLVLVFEDVHWADNGLLDFIEDLAGWEGSAPVLVVCTARPELLERRPEWDSGFKNATNLFVPPLSDDETTRLLDDIFPRNAVTASQTAALLPRIGGNPLYAEQYAQMYSDSRGEADAALPATVQGIIAARLDTLEWAEKRTLQYAAVVGNVFWLGAVVGSGGADRTAAERKLKALQRKAFVRRAHRSSMNHEVEYAFQHVLVRDVAYAQLPRRERAAQHERVAQWLEALGRIGDHAEMIAHHYMTTIELHRAMSLALDRRLIRHALDVLQRAGDRAFALNAYPSAARFYAAALELMDMDGASLGRGQLLFRLARTRYLDGDLDPTLIGQAAEALLREGDVTAAAEAEALRSECHWFRGEHSESSQYLNSALALIDGQTPSRGVTYVLTSAASNFFHDGQTATAFDLAQRAVDMTRSLGIAELEARALNVRGAARITEGDRGGLEDLEKSRRVAMQVKAPFEICRATNNLASAFYEIGEVAQYRELKSAVWDAVDRYGQVAYGKWLRAGSVIEAYQFGDWDEALAEANAVIEMVEAGDPLYFAASCYATRASIRLARDDLDGSRSDAFRAAELGRVARDPQVRLEALVCAATTLCAAGMHSEADALLDELLEGVRATPGRELYVMHRAAQLARSLNRCDELLELLPAGDSIWVRIARACARGTLAESASISGGLGLLTDEAHDRLVLGELLLSGGRMAEARRELEQALAFYQGVGATRDIRKAISLLAAC